MNSREFIGAVIVARLVVAPAILYWLLLAGIDPAPVWLGLVAVRAQVVLISGDAIYLCTTRSPRSLRAS